MPEACCTCLYEQNVTGPDGATLHPLPPLTPGCLTHTGRDRDSLNPPVATLVMNPARRPTYLHISDEAMSCDQGVVT